MDPMTKCHFCTGAVCTIAFSTYCTVCKGKGYIYAEKGDVCQNVKVEERVLTIATSLALPVEGKEWAN